MFKFLKILLKLLYKFKISIVNSFNYFYRKLIKTKSQIIYDENDYEEPFCDKKQLKYDPTCKHCKKI